MTPNSTDPKLIENVWVFISKEENGDEGVFAFSTSDGLILPMVASDHERVEQLRPIAIALARNSNRRITLVHFANRSDLEDIE